MLTPVLVQLIKGMVNVLSGVGQFRGVGGVLLAVALTVCAQAAGADQSAPLVSPVIGIETFVGQSSCLARGCHGGPDRQALPGSLDHLTALAATSANAATVWRQHDRHAHAYRVLLTERSRQIVRRWRGLTEDEYAASPPHPERETRCLACHTTPTLADERWHDHPAIVGYRREGVSCDACHTTDGGDSRQWLDPHGRGGAKAAYLSGGFRELKTAEQRARVCVGCHVGAPAVPHQGLPVRDMNHDLIAAGHPRFLFDYETYLERLPPHWQEDVPVNRFEAAVRGQREVTTAELVLLGDRAQRAMQSATPSWPEFASFDCYACHHGLQGVSWRLTALRTARPGLAAWTGWSNGGPAQVWQREQLPDALRTELVALTTHLEEFAEPERIMPAARDFQQRWQSEIGQTSLPAPAACFPVWPEDEAARWTWDEAARAYYLLATWQRQTKHELRSRPVDEPPQDQSAEMAVMERELGQLYQKLRLPSHAEHSPVLYAPEELARQYNQLRAGVERWPKSANP